MQTLAADLVGRSPGTLQDRMKADLDFSARCSWANAEWALTKAVSRRICEDWPLERARKEEFSPRHEPTGRGGGTLEPRIAGIVREVTQHAQHPQSDEAQQERG